MSVDSSNELIPVDDEMYEVEKILEKKVQRGKTLYLVKWKFWDDPKDLTWQPLENLETVSDLVKEFQRHCRQHSKKKENKEKQRKAVVSPAKYDRPQLNAIKRTKQIIKSPKRIEKNQSESKSQLQSCHQISIQSKSSSPPPKAQNHKKSDKKLPIPKIKRINYLILKNNEPFFDCDIKNSQGKCQGVMLLQLKEVSQEPDLLMRFYEDYLIQAAQRGIA